MFRRRREISAPLRRRKKTNIIRYHCCYCYCTTIVIVNNVATSNTPWTSSPGQRGAEANLREGNSRDETLSRIYPPRSRVPFLSRLMKFISFSTTDQPRLQPNVCNPMPTVHERLARLTRAPQCINPFSQSKQRRNRVTVERLAQPPFGIGPEAVSTANRHSARRRRRPRSNQGA